LLHRGRQSRRGTVKGDTMRNVRLAFFSTVLFFLTITVCHGADVAKIGVVDFQKVLTTSSAGKKAQMELGKKGKKMEAELKEKGAVIEKQRESFERESLVMSKEMRDQKVRELRIMVNDFKTLQKRYSQEFKRYESGNVQNIYKEIGLLVEELAKKEGYLLVIERRDGGLLYFPKSIDLTDTVIQAYNAKVAAQAGKEKKTNSQ